MGRGLLLELDQGMGVLVPEKLGQALADEDQLLLLLLG